MNWLTIQLWQDVKLQFLKAVILGHLHNTHSKKKFEGQSRDLIHWDYFPFPLRPLENNWVSWIEMMIYSDVSSESVWSVWMVKQVFRVHAGERAYPDRWEVGTWSTLHLTQRKKGTKTVPQGYYLLYPEFGDIFTLYVFTSASSALPDDMGRLVWKDLTEVAH